MKKTHFKDYFSNSFNKVKIKAELLQKGIFFLIHVFARDVLVMKKLEI